MKITIECTEKEIADILSAVQKNKSKENCDRWFEDNEKSEN